MPGAYRYFIQILKETSMKAHHHHHLTTTHTSTSITIFRKETRIYVFIIELVKKRLFMEKKLANGTNYSVSAKPRNNRSICSSFPISFLGVVWLPMRE